MRDAHAQNSNWPHKTLELCDCGYLERMAEDPGSPIEFDPGMNEFKFAYDGSYGRGSLTIYHCPLCGGKASELKRATFFTRIPGGEQRRLFALTQPLKTVDEIIEKLGVPDRDDEIGMTTESPEKDGEPPKVRAARTLTYTALSETADVCVNVYCDGRVSCCLYGKYIGDKAEDEQRDPAK